MMSIKHLKISFQLLKCTQKFGKISLVNIENLTFSKKNSNNYSFVRHKNYFNLIDPKSLKDLDLKSKDYPFLDT